jgi:HTH-type transcriptional regulator/antitoxin HipB
MHAKLAAAKAHAWRNGAGLGRAVRRTRESAGLTISELARQAGVGRKFLHELEAGKETLRADKVFDVLSVLGLEMSVRPARAGGSLQAKAWLKRNRSALDAYNEHVEKHGVFSEGLRAF